MSRTRRIITLDEKIEKAEIAVEKAKERYDAACKILKDLLEKKDKQKREELLNAIMNSSKSYEEILRFINEKTDEM